MTIAIKIFSGLALIFLGRKLFWLFVAAVGFVAAMTLSAQLFSTDAGWVHLLIALAGGIIGAVLAIFVQRIAVAVAGFVGGGYVLANLVTVLQLQIGNNFWIPFLIGGIIGAVLMMFIFEWALIILSSALGAYLFVHELHLSTNLEFILMVVLFIVGIVVQHNGKKKKGSKRADKSSKK